MRDFGDADSSLLVTSIERRGELFGFPALYFETWRLRRVKMKKNVRQFHARLGACPLITASPRTW
ncbi:hypothetical protein ACLOJK_020674 [Asimina triloba]